MKSSYILLIVFAGILGAQSHRLPREIENNPLMILFEKRSSEIASHCNIVSGSDEAFNNFRPLINNLTVCVTSLYNVEKIIEKYNASIFGGRPSQFSFEKLHEFVKDVCPQRSGVFTCLDEFVETAASPCLRTAEMENLNNSLKALQSLGEFICYNDVERGTQFLNDGGEECVKYVLPFLSECDEELKLHVNRQENISFFNFQFSKELCDQQQKYHQCAVNHFKKCENQSISELVAEVFEIGRKSRQLPI